MTKIVIIGAGLTGLSTAYHLEKKKFYDYTIFEKESAIGGLCRSVQQDGFTFDYTGHLLHTSDPYFRSLLETTIGINTFNSIIRKSFIYSHKTYTRYPFQINLHGLPTNIIAQCIAGYVTRKKSIKKPRSFNEWVQKSFGSGFARYFFSPYQKKIFAYDLEKITASWTGNFVPKTSLEQIIDGAINDHDDQAIGYNAQFFYPKKGGIIAWIQTLREHIKNSINTNFCVKTIDLKNKIVQFNNGHIESFDILINTMPLDRLLFCLQEKSSTTFKRACPKLLCNQVINFNIGVNRPDISSKHWIYFPESRYPFYRLGFPHNFAQSMAPAHCSSLYGEFAHINKSKEWVNQTLKRALKKTKELLNIKAAEIITEKIIHIPHAYVIYDFWREKYLPQLLTRLQEQGIYSIGRYGAWKYSSMQDAVLDGKKIAEMLTILPAKKVLHKIQTPISKKPDIQKEVT